MLCVLEGVTWEEDRYHMGDGKALIVVVGGKELFGVI